MEQPQPHLQAPPNHGDMMAMLQKPFQQIPSLPLPSAQLNSAFQPPPTQQQQQFNNNGLMQPPTQHQSPPTSAFNPIQPSALQRPPQFQPPPAFNNNNNLQQQSQMPPPTFNNNINNNNLQQQPQIQPPMNNNFQQPAQLGLNRPYQPSPQTPLQQQQQPNQQPPTSVNNLNQHMSNLNINTSNSSSRNESPFTVQSQQQQQPMMPPTVPSNASFNRPPQQMNQPPQQLNQPLQQLNQPPQQLNQPPQQLNQPQQQMNLPPTSMYGQQQQQQPSYMQSPQIPNGPPISSQGPPQTGQFQGPPTGGAFMAPPSIRPPGSLGPSSLSGPSSSYPQPQQQQYSGGMMPPPGSQQGPPMNQQYPPSGPSPMMQQPQFANQPMRPPLLNQQYPGQPGPGPTTPYDQNYPSQQQQQQPQSYPYQQPQQPMQQQQPQQSKMDMDQIPNPIEVANVNNTKYAGDFETNEAGKIPPLITTDFICKDMGNCNPRFIRSTMYSIPSNPDLLKQSKMPIVLNLTPFADLRPEEREPPVSNLGELGPVRCKRCKAYMSPFMKFIDNGKKFSCPFCEDVTVVPQEYFNHLDHMGRRVDMYERPELCLGSYEFVATKDYCRQQTLPQPPAFIFMIDVSVNSVRSGLLHVLCPYIKNEILPNLPVDKLNPDGQAELRVGFVTYDKELHFYNLKSTLAAPQMMIVSDMEEVFVPILDGFLVKLSESKSVIDILLDTLPAMFSENKETELLLGPVIESGIEALKSAKLSGKLFIFHSNLPNALAPGQLKNRDDKKLLGTEKEKQVLTPQNDYYGLLGKKCLENGCCVDFFLLPNQYCDLATISDLNKKAGGQIYKYDFFTADSQGQRLCEDLKYAIESTVAFDSVMKIRTSTGIKPVDYLGNFNMYGNDVEVAGLQKSTSLAVELKHDDKLNENSVVYIQLALLYTSLSGQRRIRLHNLSLSVCTQYSQMFSSCELDSLINYIAKLACRSVTVSNPKSIRENLVVQVASILASYRKNCTNTPSKGQFILPETLKLLPVFSNSLLKSDAISGSQNISIDERAYLMHRLMSMDIESTYAYFYPRVIPLHDMESPENFPAPVRCIYERLKDDGIYLLENGLVLYLWLGINVDPTVIQNLFGVAGTQQLNTEKCKLLELNTKISENVRSVIRTVNEQRKANLKLIVVRQRDNLEIFFKNLLVEDKGHMPNGSSYVDFLYQLHREIKNILS